MLCHMPLLVGDSSDCTLTDKLLPPPVPTPREDVGTADQGVGGLEWGRGRLSPRP